MRAARVVALAIIAAALATPVAAQAPRRSLGHMDLAIPGFTATVVPSNPVIPKNVASAVRVVVTAGGQELTAGDVARFVGAGFEVAAELSGPGLRDTLLLPQRDPDAPLPADPLLLAIPALPTGGDYELRNVRLVVAGRPVLDVAARVPVQVIDQVLVTSVKTRPLTLAEIKEKGIVLDSDDYLGFEFTLGLKFESNPVTLQFPVVFDRNGVPVPQGTSPPAAPFRKGVDLPPLPTIIPMLLDALPEEGEPLTSPRTKLTGPDGEPIRIPSVIVIPGNVGYLKQFFSAQLFVANGAPVGSGLSVRGVTGTVHLPPGADREPGTADDPLALPELEREGRTIVQPATMPVRGVGLDGAPGTADDADVLDPGDQGQAEFLIRGEQEGFHTLDFDVAAVLEGLPVGPVRIGGKAQGAVLVRNPYFDVSFTVPSVVRKGETFKFVVTVTNVGQGIANDFGVSLDEAAVSGAQLLGERTLRVDTLKPGDARNLTFSFSAQRTGQVVASYLHFDTQAVGGGEIRFTVGIGERGVPLSPDTLVLPAAVDALPSSVVDAAMRVLGQAWSLANAPAGTLPPGVLRTSRTTVTQKALALAEAGLRVSFGETPPSAARDLLHDFYAGGDAGFDQLLRTTEAGRGLATAIGAALGDAVTAAGGPLGYEAEMAGLTASSGDFVSFAVAGASGVGLVDAAGRQMVSGDASVPIPTAELSGAVLVPLGSAGQLGLLTAPEAAPFRLALAGAGGPVDVAVTLPNGDGTFVHGVIRGVDLPAGAHARVVLDLSRPDVLRLERDMDGDGAYEGQDALAVSLLPTDGPRLVAAAVVGPETLSGASPYGFQAVLLFDRTVDTASASDKTRYAVPSNSVLGAHAFMSGRLVLAYLAQPEGPYVPTTVTASGLLDGRGVGGPAATVPLQSRLQAPGAVVSGRVFSSDGTEVTGTVVTYSNNPRPDECDQYDFTRSGLAALPLDGGGRYEFRYVMQDHCGWPWHILLKEPATGALRSVSGYVRAAGERIVLDIALFGRGSVGGTVRDLSGAPVPGARVTAVSGSDPQIGGTTTTDGDGHYLVSGITVGPVNVTAGLGASIGRNSGRVERAGTTSTVDVVLDGGTVSVSGTVRKLEDGVLSLVAGAQVVYYLVPAPGSPGNPMAVTTTDAQGGYAFHGMPVGNFVVSAALNTRDSAGVGGLAAADDVLLGRDIVITILSEQTGYGTVRGVVHTAEGGPAAGAVVSIGQRGALTTDDGTFELRGIAVRPYQPQSIQAATRDGLRSGSAEVLINAPGDVVEGLVITLSGLGAVEFNVLDVAGAPVAGQQVSLPGNCGDPCGCATKTTDPAGRVRFENLRLGTVTAQAIRESGAFVDVANGSASIRHDGETGFGILRFAGGGTVTGLVLDPDGRPSFGADLALSSRHYVNDGVEECGLVNGVSHRIRTDTTGHFRFNGVNLGPVSLVASQPFFPTQVGAQGALVQNGQNVDFTLHLVNTISGELAGTVFLPDGATPAGAGVEVTANGVLPDVVVKTDDQGRFHFAKIFPEGYYSLTARDPVTGGVAQDVVFLRTGESLQHDLRLLGRGTVRVHVVDGADQPVTDAFVRLRESAYPRSSYEGAAEEASQGVAEFEGVYEGPFSVEASDSFARGGRASGVLPKGAGGTVDVTVRLTVTGKVTGRFFMPDHVTPIPYGIVRLVAGGGVIGQTTAAGTGDVGSFSFDYVPAGAVRVEAQDPVTARTGVAVGTLDTEGQVLSLDVVAEGLGTVGGRVTSNGAPRSGANVDLVAGGFRAASMTDGEGRYLVRGVPEGQVTVTASLSNGFLSGTASAALAGDGTTVAIDVALRDSGRVEGQVVQSDGATAAPPSVVSLWAGGTGGGGQSTTTDIDGRFVFDRVPSGPVQLSAQVLGGIDRARGGADVPSAGTATAQLRLNGVGSLTGRALDSVGAPVAGDVSIDGTGPFGYSFHLRLGADGLFRLPEVMAGPFTASLTAVTGEFRLYGTAAGEVPPGGTGDVTVQLQPSGTVTGLLVRADGQTPAVGTDVVLRRENGLAVVLQAQNDGRFTARGVPLGPFSVSASDPLTGGVARVPGRSVDADGQTVDLGTIALDDSPIAVSAVDPVDGSAGVALDRVVHVTVTDPIASAAGVQVRAGGVAVPAGGAVSADGLMLTLTGPWPDARDLEVVVPTTVTDVFGRHPAQAFSSHFHTVDLSPPVVASVDPAPQAIQVAPTAVVTVTFDEDLDASTDGGALIALTTAAGPVAGTSALTDPRTATFTPSAPLPADLAFTVVVNGAVDLSGNRQTAPFHSTFATLDTVAPTLALSAPVPGAMIAVPNPTVIVSMSDGLSGVDAASATLSLDGGVVTPVRTASTLTFATPPLRDGQHPVEAAVSDRAGNRATLTAAFTTDTTAPGAAVLTGLVSGQVVRGPASIAASASDATSGVARVDVLDQAAVVATLSGPALAGSLDTTRLAEGAHTLSARAVDVAGNVGPVGPPLTVVVDNRPLTIVLSAPSGARVRNGVTVVAIVSEPVLRVDFAVSGTTLAASVSAPPYEAAFDLSALAEGTFAVNATAYDVAGEAVPATLPVVVDRTPPAAPDASRIAIDPVDGGSIVVRGHSLAVEASATVEASASGTVRTGSAAGDGSFAVRMPGITSGVVTLIAIDAAGNRSLPTDVTVDTTLTPEGIPVSGMRMWLRADMGISKDGAGLVSRWDDQSGSGNHLLQGTASQQPTWTDAAAGGLPALHFDGSNDVLGFTSRLTTIRTVFWVLREDPSSAAVRRVLLGDCCEFNLITADSSYNIWNSTYTSPNIINGQTYLNGQPVDGRSTPLPKQMAVLSVVTTGSVIASNLGNDRSESTWWFGDVAELIVYDRPLSGADRKAVEDYLALKYALYTPPVGTPTLSPNGGSFSGSTIVSMTSGTPGAEIRYTLDGTDPNGVSPLYTDPLLVTATTTVKAAAFKTGQPESGIASATFVDVDAFTPLSVPGASLWLRADAGAVADSAGRVAAWADQSGNGNDLGQPTSYYQPRIVTDAAGGLPAVHFDGSDDVLGFTSRLTTIRTVFWVLREDPSSAAVRRVLLGDCCEFNLITADSSYNIWNSAYTSPNIINGQTYLNGQPVDGRSTPLPKQMAVLSVVTTGNVIANNFGRDRSDSTWWFGDLAELIVYDRPLSTPERQSVEAYLAQKYQVYAPQAAAPTFSPNGGVLSSTGAVQMASSNGAEIHYTTDGSSEPTLDSPVYTGPLTFADTTTVKAKAFGSGLSASATTTVTFLSPSAFSPASVPSLKLWVRADAGAAVDSAGRVSAWADQSASGNTLSQGYPFYEPTVVQNASGGLPVLHFDGSNDVLGFTSRLTAIRTVFWVLREDPSSAAVRRVLLGDCCEFNLITADSSYNIWNSSYTSSYILNGQTYLNGTLVDGRATPLPKQMSVLSVVTTGNVIANNFGHDRSDDTWWFGDVAELIVYDQPLTEADRKAVEDYLARRWDVPFGVAATPTISPAGSTFTPPLAVTLATSTTEASIGYTTDGSEPTRSSAVYEGPITIDHSTVLKAKAFRRGMASSATATATFLDGSAAQEMTITGRVVDADGNPLGGVTVSCGTATGTTDADGRFTIEQVPTSGVATVACAFTATLSDGTLVHDLSARAPALPGTVADVGTTALMKPTYMGYNPQDAATLTVLGWTDGTAYQLSSLDDGRLVSSGTVNRFGAVGLPLSGLRHFKLETSAPVQATFGFDCCNFGGSFFYPATDGRALVGRDFVIRIPTLAGNNEFVAFAHEPATLTIRNTAGTVLVNQTLAAGKFYATTGSPLAVGVAYQVQSTGDVSLMSNSGNAFAAIPARTGGDAGTDFLFATLNYSTAGAAVFAYDEAVVTATNAATGAVAFTQSLPAGQFTFVNGLGTAKYHLTSTGRVGVFAGSTEAGSAVRDLGDDATVTIGDHGRDFLVHSLSQGAFVFALERDTHVTINGTSYILDRGQFRDLAPDGLWRITADKPITVQAIGGNGLNDWQAALRLVQR